MTAPSGAPGIPPGRSTRTGHPGGPPGEAAVPLERRDAGVVQPEERVVPLLECFELGPVDLLPRERSGLDLLLEPAVGQRIVPLGQSQAGVYEPLDPCDVAAALVQLRGGELLPGPFLQLSCFVGR